MRSWVVLVLVGLLTFVAGVDRVGITESDEAYYAEAGREMVEGGDYLTPHFNYEPRFQKPILFYWVVAASYRLLGVNELAARLGAILAGAGLVMLAFAAGRRWFDRATGLLAGAMVATSFGCSAVARMSLPDLPLAFFSTAAAYAGLVPLFGKVPSPRPWWALAGGAAGLAFLTKGPIGVVIPMLVLAPAVFVARRRQRPDAAALLAAAGVFLIVAAPWYAAMAREHGVGYLRGFFVGDNLERFATARFNDPRPFWYYVPILIGGLLPWSPFALLLVPASRRWRLRRERLTPFVLVHAIWIVAVLLLLTLSVGKQPRYILPVLLPAVLLLARAIREVTSAPSTPPGRPDRWLRAAAVASGGTLLVLAALVLRAGPLLAEVGHGRLVAAAIVVGGSGLAVAATAVSARWRRAPVVIVVAGALSMAAIQYGALSVPGPDAVERVAQHVLTHRRPGDQVGLYRVFARNLIFYSRIPQVELFSRQQLTDFLTSPDRVLCVAPDDEVARLEREGRVTVRRLADVRFFDASTAKLRTWLSPDPARDRQTAVLFSNR